MSVLKPSTSLVSMDALRYWEYHFTKSANIDTLPPTSRSLKPHMERAFYATYLKLHLLDPNTAALEPVLYGYDKDDSLLMPRKNIKLEPDYLIRECKCQKCATIQCNYWCTCRQIPAPCIEYCQSAQLVECKNPCLFICIA